MVLVNNIAHTREQMSEKTMRERVLFDARKLSNTSWCSSSGVYRTLDHKVMKITKRRGNRMSLNVISKFLYTCDHSLGEGKDEEF